MLDYQSEAPLFCTRLTNRNASNQNQCLLTQQIKHIIDVDLITKRFYNYGATSTLMLGINNVFNDLQNS